MVEVDLLMMEEILQNFGSKRTYEIRDVCHVNWSRISCVNNPVREDVRLYCLNSKFWYHMVISQFEHIHYYYHGCICLHKRMNTNPLMKKTCQLKITIWNHPLLKGPNTGFYHKTKCKKKIVSFCFLLQQIPCWGPGRKQSQNSSDKSNLRGKCKHTRCHCMNQGAEQNEMWMKQLTQSFLDSKSPHVIQPCVIPFHHPDICPCNFHEKS